jgi:hypothetical protein
MPTSEFTVPSQLWFLSHFKLYRRQMEPSLKMDIPEVSGASSTIQSQNTLACVL